MVDKEMLEAMKAIQADTLAQIDEKLEKRIQGLRLEIGEMGAALEARIEESQRETMVFVENSVGKRIDSLFDGYKLTHEKQWEMERRMEQMEQRLSALENRAG